MLAVPHLYADIEQLPTDLQIEVSHYVRFLLEKVKKTIQVFKKRQMKYKQIIHKKFWR